MFRKVQSTRTLLIVGLIILVTSILFAYEISWWSIDSGGAISSGGSYYLIGIVGQLDAGVLTGGSYTLSGGFLQRDIGTTFSEVWYLY